MIFFALSHAFAQASTSDVAPEIPSVDKEVAGEIFIWSDSFARWRDTRWHIVSELVLPTGYQLMTKTNKHFDTIAIQLRSVLACNPEYERKRMQVGCTIEDLSIQSTSVRRFRTERDRQLVQEVLDELDTELTGAVLQMQTNERGAITNLDIEGLDPRNLRERVRAEMLRQLVGRLAYPFHVKLPKTIRTGTNWPEYDSALMRMPADLGSQGSSVIVHYLNAYEDHLLVQDIGQGQVVLTPAERTQGLTRSPAPPDAAMDSSVTLKSTQGLGGQGGMQLPTADNSPNSLNGVNAEGFRTIGTPYQYKLDLNGVSIYDPDTGVMKERVWSMQGRGNSQLATQLPLWSAGRIRLLEKGAQVDLGPTGQIGYPWFSVKELPDWTSVDPDIGAPVSPSDSTMSAE